MTTAITPREAVELSSKHGVEWHAHDQKKLLMCGIPKVGITNLATAGFRPLQVGPPPPHAKPNSRPELQESHFRPPWRRAALVRSPFERFGSFYRNKIQMLAVSHGKTLNLSTSAHVEV